MDALNQDEWQIDLYTTTNSEGLIIPAQRRFTFILDIGKAINQNLLLFKHSSSLDPIPLLITIKRKEKLTSWTTARVDKWAFSVGKDFIHHEQWKGCTNYTEIEEVGHRWSRSSNHIITFILSEIKPLEIWLSSSSTDVIQDGVVKVHIANVIQ